jgi:hypothetical protein
MEPDNPAEASEWAELARRMAELGREDPPPAPPSRRASRGMMLHSGMIPDLVDQIPTDRGERPQREFRQGGRLRLGMGGRLHVGMGGRLRRNPHPSPRPPPRPWKPAPWGQSQPVGS